MNKRRTFNILRFIAILAMVLTLFATTFMLIQSSLSGEQSSAVSGAISGDRSKEVVVEAEQKDIPTKKLVLTQAVGYNNEPIKPNITYVPSESTDREIIWSIKDYWYPLNEHKDETLATIDEKGYVTFYHTGSITLVATLKSNPKVTASCVVFSNGPSPKHITSLTPVQKEFYQGEYSNFYLKDQDGNIVRPRDYTISYLHGNIIQLDSFKYEALNIGKETITFAHKDLKEPISFEIEVKENPNFIPIQKLKGNPKLINENNEYRIKPYTRFSAYDLVSTEPEKAIDTGIFTFTLEQEKGKKILKNNDSDFISQDVGTAKLKITSKIDPSKSVTISIIVYIDPPEAIDIIPSSNIIIVDGLYSLKTFGDNGYYVDDVTYEVIEGRATFTGNKFRAKSLGRLVIRATYNEDPSLYTEIEIDVKLFKTFGQFIRKILGHLLLFQPLGLAFGLSICSCLKNVGYLIF